MNPAAVFAGFACALGGVALLRLAWRRRGGGVLIAGGWLLLATGAPAWLWSGAAVDKAVAFAVLVPGLVALAWIAATAELPSAEAKPRPRTAAIEPPAAPGPAWRGWVRAVLAGPLGLAAGVAVAVLVGVHAGGSAAERLVLAGTALPAVWASALVWATTDERLGRIAAGLGGVVVVGVLGALL